MESPYIDGEYSQLVKLHASHISREGTRGHRFKLCQEGSKLNIRRHSFPVRITKVWNELPDSVVNAPNVNTFKKQVGQTLERRRLPIQLRSTRTRTPPG